MLGAPRRPAAESWQYRNDFYAHQEVARAKEKRRASVAPDAGCSIVVMAEIIFISAW